MRITDFTPEELRARRNSETDIAYFDMGYSTPVEGDIIQSKGAWGYVGRVLETAHEYQVQVNGISSQYLPYTGDRVYLYRQSEMVPQLTRGEEIVVSSRGTITVNDSAKVEVGDVVLADGKVRRVSDIFPSRLSEYNLDLTPPVNKYGSYSVYLPPSFEVKQETRRFTISKPSAVTVRDDTKWEDYKYTKVGSSGYRDELWEVNVYPDGRKEYVRKIRDVRTVQPVADVVTIGTKPVNWTKERREVKRGVLEIVYEDDPDKYTDYNFIKRQGTPPEVEYRYRDTYFKENRVSVEVISQTSVSAGVSRIIVRGTKKIDYLWRRVRVTYHDGRETLQGEEYIEPSLNPKIEVLTTEFEAYQKQTNEKIESKVSQTTYNQEREKIEGRFSEIIQEANSIITTVGEEAFSSIEDLRGSVNQQMSEKVSAEQYLEDKRKIDSDISAAALSVKQTKDDFSLIFSRLERSVDDNSEEIRKLAGVISSGLDSNGEVYTDWIGGRGNRVRVSSDGIALMNGGTNTMTLRDGEVRAASLYVKNTIGFGNHTAVKYGTDYTIFSWTGNN